MKKIVRNIMYMVIVCCAMMLFEVSVFADYKYIPIEDCISIVEQIESDDNNIILTDRQIEAIDRVLEYDYERAENGEKQVEQINLDRDNIVLAVGEVSDPIIAELLPKNGLGGRLTWYSSNPSVVTVDQNGVVTAIKSGSAGVFCESENEIVAALGIYVVPNVPLSERLSLSINGPIRDEYYIGDIIDLRSAYKGYLNENMAERVLSVDTEGVVECLEVSKGVSDVYTETILYKGKNYFCTYNGDANLNNYRFVAKGPGTVTITLTLKNGCSTSRTITVLPDETDIALSDSSIELEVGESKELTAEITPEGASKYVTWKSDNPSVATADSNGKITAVSEGTAVISASTKHGLTASCTVKVISHSEPESITISSEYVKLEPEKTHQLSLTAQPENASLKNIKWSSDNTGVAVVDENGCVTAISEGTATICACAENGVKAECMIEVVYFAESIRAYIDSVYLYKDLVDKIYVTATPSTAKLDLEYSSSNPDVTISADGSIHAVDTGSVTITVRDKNSNLTYTIKRRVRIKNEVSNIILQSNSMNLKVGETQALLYTLYPIGIKSEVSITTENPDIIAINKTDITGLKPGVAKINVTAGNITKSISVTVRKADSYDVSYITLNKTVYNVKVGDIFNIDYDSDISTTMFGMNWHTSSPTIASVNHNGTVTANAVGHVTITVTAGTLEPQTCDVFISEADDIGDISSVCFDLDCRTLTLTVGDVKAISSLGYTVTPESFTDKVRVESLNPKILEVTNNNIIAKAYGKADLKVYIPGRHFCTITVYVYKNETETAIEQKSFAKEVLDCMNVYRAKAGVPLLTLKDDISALAQIRAEECKTNYSHTRPDGSKWSTIFNNTKYATKFRGENLLKVSGYGTAQSLVDFWMSSPSHKYNILNSHFSSVGVGSILAINTSDTDSVASICALLFVE